MDLSLAMAIVGSSVVFGKIIVQAFPVFLASGLRFAIASAIMLPLVFRRERGWRAFSRRDWAILALMAFCGQFIFTVLLLLGLKWTSAVEAGIITSMSPAAMAMVSYLVLREALGRRRLMGVVLAVVGILAVNGYLMPSADSPGRVHLPGNLLVLGAVMGEAFFLLLRKTINPQVSELAMAGALTFLGLIMFFPLALFQAWHFDFHQTTLIDWLAIFYFGAIFTVLAYILWFRGVARVSGATAGVFTAVMPLSAMGLSYLFLKESFSWTHVIGLACVLAAIGLITLEKETPDPSQPRELDEGVLNPRA